MMKWIVIGWMLIMIVATFQFSSLKSFYDAVPNEGFGGNSYGRNDTLFFSAMVSSQGNGKSGVCYVRQKDAGGSNNYGQVAMLTGTWPGLSPNREFFSLRIVTEVPSYVIVSGHGYGNASEGATYVFLRDLGGPSAWGMSQRLIGPPLSGSSFSMSIAGNTLAVGGTGFVFLKLTRF